MTKIIFDVETNGLDSTSSVLSFSALVIDENNKVIKEFDRYYHLADNEVPNDIAININGLTSFASQKYGNAKLEDIWLKNSNIPGAHIDVSDTKKLCD